MTELTVQFGVKYERSLFGGLYWRDDLNMIEEDAGSASRIMAIKLAEEMRTKPQLYRNIRIVSRIIGPWVEEMSQR
jgi:hypothetical protein